MVDHGDPTSRPLRIALAHDWLVGMRGGERVLEAIARTLAPHHRLTAIYTMFDDGRPLSPHLDPIPKRVSPLARLPLAGRVRRWLLPLYPWGVEQLSERLARDHAREPIDLLISTSSAAIKGLKPPPGVPHLCYCHTPARYLWSQTDQYAGGLRGLGLRLFGPALKRWDRRTAANVTAFLANSTHTQREIQRCYGRESTVLFPPVRTDFFTPKGAEAQTEPPTASIPLPSSFWLGVGALEPYKRFDLALAAARLARKPIVIAGTGSEEPTLRRLAGADAIFLGRVSDEQLRGLYRAADLLVFPQIEDFGITAVEAQACGCPVLARAAGGALDTVIDGTSGALCDWDEADTTTLRDAIDRVPKRSPATTAACRASAERFSEVRFAGAFRQAVDDAVSKHA